MKMTVEWGDGVRVLPPPGPDVVTTDRPVSEHIREVIRRALARDLARLRNVS